MAARPFNTMRVSSAIAPSGRGAGRSGRNSGCSASSAAADYRLAAGEAFERSTSRPRLAGRARRSPAARSAARRSRSFRATAQGHRFSPTNVPYRANIYALKALGATHVVSISAVGSLRDDLPPRSLVVPDQIIDRTVAAATHVFRRRRRRHVGLADPYCEMLRERLSKRPGRPASRSGKAGPIFASKDRNFRPAPNRACFAPGAPRSSA